MQIIIHGTNSGYSVTPFYKTVNAEDVARFDIRQESRIPGFLGEIFYGLTLHNKYAVYTIYKIVLDTRRSDARGFVAVSLYLPKNGHSISDLGNSILTLLNELLDSYANQYIVENRMNRGNKTDAISVDGSFVETILSKHKFRELETEVKVPGIVSKNSGESACIIYNEQSELVSYLSRPFQEEYADYGVVMIKISYLWTYENRTNTKALS